MGAEQFSTPVRGASGSPISVAQTGTIETDNYSHAGSASAGANGESAYPLAVNPAPVIQELIVTANAPELVINVHTTGGDVYEAFDGGTLGDRDKVEMDKVVVTDPNGSGATVALEWAGE